MGVAWEAEVVVRTRISTTETVKEEIVMSIFQKLKPVATDGGDQLTIAAIDSEIDQCQAIVRDYARQLDQGRREMDEIKRHVQGLQKERKRLARGSH